MSETLVRDPEALAAAMRKRLPEPEDLATGDLADLNGVLRRQRETEARIEQEIRDMEARKREYQTRLEAGKPGDDLIQLAACREGVNLMERHIDRLKKELIEARLLVGHAKRRADGATARYHEARNMAVHAAGRGEALATEHQITLRQMAGVDV
jgi:chromosome segregation ATPase